MNPIKKPIEMKIYIAGPMTGIPEFNFPAFNEVVARIRSLGHRVINPAENPGIDTSKPWGYYIKRDIYNLLNCDAIAMLPGSEKSKGAMLEMRIASDLGMKVFNAARFPEELRSPDSIKPATLDTAMGVAALEKALECVELLDRKQKDYGSGNISTFGEFGVLVRLNDKVERLKNLHKTGKAPNNEAMKDTWMDVVNYGLIGLLCHLGLWK